MQYVLSSVYKERWMKEDVDLEQRENNHEMQAASRSFSPLSPPSLSLTRARTHTILQASLFNGY